MLYNLLYSICYNRLIFFRYAMLYNWKTPYNLLGNVCYNGLDYVPTCYTTCYTGISRYKILIPKHGLHNCNTLFHVDWPVKKKSVEETNKYLPLLLGCKSQVKCHAYPTVLVVFLVSFLLFSLIKPLIGSVVFYLLVYHCPYPFSFAEANIFQLTWRIPTPNWTQADKLFSAVI